MPSVLFGEKKRNYSNTSFMNVYDNNTFLKLRDSTLKNLVTTTSEQVTADLDGAA